MPTLSLIHIYDSLYNKYKDRVGQVISGEGYQVWKREVLIVDDETNELMLPKTEQIPGDPYRKGETVRAVILRVDLSLIHIFFDLRNNGGGSVTEAVSIINMFLPKGKTVLEMKGKLDVYKRQFLPSASSTSTSLPMKLIYCCGTLNG